MKIKRVILDPGHGGMAFGQYMTKGKRSPIVGAGLGIYEGEFNRSICELLKKWFVHYGLQCEITNSGPANMPLRARVGFVNELCAGRDDTILLSIHANAMGKHGWNDAHGTVVFTSRKIATFTLKRRSNKSIELAENIEYELGFLARFESRGIKHKNFAMVAKTKCPAVLVECGFMTHRGDAAFLATTRGVGSVATQIFDGVRGCFDA